MNCIHQNFVLCVKQDFNRSERIYEFFLYVLTSQLHSDVWESNFNPKSYDSFWMLFVFSYLVSNLRKTNMFFIWSMSVVRYTCSAGILFTVLCQRSVTGSFIRITKIHFIFMSTNTHTRAHTYEPNTETDSNGIRTYVFTAASHTETNKK